MSHRLASNWIAAAALAVCVFLLSSAVLAQNAERFEPVHLKSKITHVQPMTGLVLWASSAKNQTNAVQLEFSYMKYSDVVRERG